MTNTVLCADIGTTSLKAGLITEEGEVVSVASAKILVKEEEKSFIAEKWMAAFNCAVKKVFAGISSAESGNNCKKINICALSISGNGPTVVSQNGRTELWNEDYSQGQKLMQQLAAESNISAHSLFVPKILTLKNKYPSDFSAAEYIFSGPEYLIYKLTGNTVTILPEDRYVSAYWDDELLKACRIPVGKMPPYYDYSQSYGELKSEHLENLKTIAAECTCKENPSDNGDSGSASEIEISVPDKLNVYGAGPDFIAALIGTNTLKPGRICDRSGSSEGLNYCVPVCVRYYGIRTLPSVIPGLWNVSVLIPRSGKLNENKRIYAVKDAVRTLRAIAKQYGFIFPEKLFVTGGQTRNAGYMKRKRNELGMELSIANCDDAELLGDACVAFYALGKYKSLQSAAEKIVHEKSFAI
ncbi:MAG: hypothetical protein K6A89_12645 [Treponema sp.]|nr:hypothetical protein [Treponema sp.]